MSESLFKFTFWIELTIFSGHLHFSGKKQMMHLRLSPKLR